MTFLIRQLAPTEKGLPIEIYVFVNDVRWVHYEAIQSDIFDHLLASFPFLIFVLFSCPVIPVSCIYLDECPHRLVVSRIIFIHAFSFYGCLDREDGIG